MANSSLRDGLGIYCFLSDPALKVELGGLCLARSSLGGIGDDVNLCFVEFAIKEPGKIGILTLIWELVVSDCFPLSSLFLASF